MFLPDLRFIIEGTIKINTLKVRCRSKIYNRGDYSINVMEYSGINKLGSSVFIFFQEINFIVGCSI